MNDFRPSKRVFPVHSKYFTVLFCPQKIHLPLKLMKLPPNIIIGSTVWPLNGYGSGLNQMSWSSGLFFNSTGNQLYILDTFNYRVLKWTIGTSAATVVAGGNGSGSALSQFSAAWGGLTVDTLSNVYISDYSNYRILKWPPGAVTGQVVAGGNGQGSGANQLYYPWNIAVDTQFTLYVADPGNRRIQVC